MKADIKVLRGGMYFDFLGTTLHKQREILRNEIVSETCLSHILLEKLVRVVTAVFWSRSREFGISLGKTCFLSRTNTSQSRELPYSLISVGWFLEKFNILSCISAFNSRVLVNHHFCKSEECLKASLPHSWSFSFSIKFLVQSFMCYNSI